jgi:hypothetical protein
MPDIVWEDPPEGRGPETRLTKWAIIGAALRSRPGEWALVEVKPSAAIASSVARNIRLGLVRVGQPGEFDATSRNIDGEFRVYARYVGGDSNA